MKKLKFNNQTVILILLQLAAIICFILSLANGSPEVGIACGIFGIINTKKKMKFDYSQFCVLGIGNDSRGGDSCGVFIDGMYDWGAYKEKLFSDFLSTSNILKDAREQEVSVALGHCRKASVGLGALDKEHAQPVVITDKSGRVRFVMIHNGTIHNYEELAKKYIPKIDIKGMTDSQVMARIFYNTGYQVLSEYYGGSVFFIVDYRQPGNPAFIFQGKSKDTNYSTTETIERPFYFCMNKEGQFVFSSIRIYLDVLYPDSTVYGVRQNTLLKLTNKGLAIIKDYPRTAVSQARPTTYIASTYKSYQSTYPGTVHTAGGVSTEENDWLQETRSYSSVKTTTPGTTATSTTTKKDAVYKDSLQLDKDRNCYCTYKSKTPLDGEFIVSIWGGIYEGEIEADGKTANGVEVKRVYFFNGIPLDLKFGEHYYKFLKRICNCQKITPDELVEKFQNAIRYLSISKVYKDKKLNTSVIATSLKENSVFSGDVYQIGCCKVDTYVNGQFTGNSEDYAKYGQIFKNAEIEQLVEHIPYRTIRFACLDNI